MLVKDIMTHNVEVVGPDDSLTQAARKMGELNVGPMPVCEGNRVVGILTDRDITVRATAAGRDPNTTRVREVMSRQIISCAEDEDVREVARIMKDEQIRRILVLSPAGDLMGIVSLGDLATDVGEHGQTGEVLHQVSQNP